MQSETLAQEFARLVKEYHEGDDRTKPEAWNLLADYAVDNAEAITAALSDKQAGEVSCIACEGRPSAGNNPCAVCGRSALVDVPAVEPVGDVGEMPGSNGGFTMAVFKASDVPLGTKLYTSPPLSREGEDSAEVIAKSRALASAILQHFAAMEDGDGNEAPELAMARDLLAATRSGSATNQKGTGHE